MQPSETTGETLTATTNRGFITRWNRLSANMEVQLFGGLYSGICNVLLYMLPGVRLHIRLTKIRLSIYLMNKSVESEIVFKFLTPNYWRDVSGQTPPYCWLRFQQ